MTVPAPLDEIPLFVRAGAVVALLPPDVETLSGHGTASGIVHLRDRLNAMRLPAFPRGSSTSTFNAGERMDSSEGDRSWTLRIHGARTRAHRLEASLATLHRPFTPCGVRLGRRPLRRSAWAYDHGRRLLTASFTTRSGLLRVRGCGRGSASAAKLRLSVRPSRARTGCRRFAFRATSGRGARRRARRGASVRFRGRLARTDRRGFARMRACLRRPGRYRARARKTGYRTTTATVTATRALPRPRFAG